MTSSVWWGITLALFFLALVLFYRLLTSTHSYWKDRGVPYLPPVPIFGTAASVMLMREHFIDFLKRHYDTYEGHRYFGMFSGSRPTLLIRDPELAKHIFVKDFQHFTDHGIKIDVNRDPIEGRSLFHLTGQKWHDMRVKLAPTFTSGRMKAMFPLMNACAVRLEKYLEDLASTRQPFEAKDILSRFTTDVISSSVFGVECDSLRDPDCEFRRMGKRLVDLDFWKATRMLIFVMLPEIAEYLPTSSIHDSETISFFRRLVRDVIEERKRVGTTRRDFIQLLIDLKEKGRLNEVGQEEDRANEDAGSDVKMTEDDIVAQGAVFFLAGFETSSAAASFALLELAHYPEIQTRARREIGEVLERHAGRLTYQAFQEIKYLDWIVNESLRKHPPVHQQMRTCTKKYVIPESSLTIDEDVWVIYPTCTIQNDPRYFPEPERFDPERFSGDKHKYQYLFAPFGEGPRQCIGNRYAMLQTKLGLYSFLRKFEIRPCEKTKFPPEYDPKQFVLATKHGVWIEIVPI